MVKQKSECERAIGHLLDLAESFGARAAAERLRDREVERERITVELHQLDVKRQAAQLEIAPEALRLTLATWSGELADVTGTGDILAVRNFLKRFVAKIELGYNTARIWYTYPIDALQANGGNPCGDT